jgi:eukaryotic-like serine/threonine-protein kinase
MTLSATRIADLSRLLDQALALDATGRLRWLNQLESEHRALEPALRRVLTSGDTVDDPIGLETVARIRAGCVFARGLAPGELVGPYRLKHRLGAGGMAEVWVAQRADNAFEREVALKVPMLSRMRPDLMPRFARECEILARLEHPHIARLLDAAISKDGLPYIAMERVAGDPITDWCNRRRLGLRDRIRLFLQVLDAVQCAHERRVIHRDLKPSNILVTEDGEARLLDFGVAKLLTEQDQPEPAITRLYGRALTPDYASPELVRGEPFGATSDVYSLGVVLYELLTGSRPYRIRTSSSCLQVEHAISTARVVRPSVQTKRQTGGVRVPSTRELARGLRGDLDAIVLKAISRDPQRRYSSVRALAADLQRHLNGKPVEALLDSVPYRIGNFLCRHGACLAIAVVMIWAHEVLRA